MSYSKKREIEKRKHWVEEIFLQAIVQSIILSRLKCWIDSVQEIITNTISN